MKAEERPHDVDGMGARKLFLGDLHEWFEQRMAGVGDEDVEAGEGLDGLAKEPGHLAPPRDVGRDRSRRAAPRGDRLDDVERLSAAFA